MSLKDRAASLLKNASLLPIYDFAGGLSEFWAVVFGIPGIVLAFMGKLTAEYATMITAIVGLLTVHDALDDMHTRKMRERDDRQSPPGVVFTEK